jgi:hypothetical protein
MASPACERCEAFTPVEPSADTVARYEKNGAFVPLLSKMMLSLQEDPVARSEQLKSHLEAVQERSAVRQIVSSLPIREAQDGTKRTHTSNYQVEKATVRLCHA